MAEFYKACIRQQQRSVAQNGHVFAGLGTGLYRKSAEDPGTHYDDTGDGYPVLESISCQNFGAALLRLGWTYRNANALLCCQDLGWHPQIFSLSF